jgi:poly(A) polymerase
VERLRPERLLTGNDLIAAGYEPGPQFSEILQAVEDAQLEGALSSKEEALAFAAERFGPPPDIRLGIPLT